MGITLVTYQLVDPYANLAALKQCNRQYFFGSYKVLLVKLQIYSTGKQGSIVLSGSFHNNARHVLGNDIASPTSRLTITFNDATGSNGFTTTLGTIALTGSSKTINLPNENGTICIQSSAQIAVS